MTDHAPNETAANNKFGEVLCIRAAKFIEGWDLLTPTQQSDFTVLIQTKCCDHKRNLFCDEAVKFEDASLKDIIGFDKDSWEIGRGSICNYVLLQIHK